MKRIGMLLSCVLASAPLSIGQAANLGRLGPVYPIQETDFLSFIRQRAQTLKKTGQWQKMQRRFQRQARDQMRRPKPVQGLSRTTRHHVFYVDPTIRLTHDLTDAKGHVIRYRGETLNPLDRVTMHKRLILFNGDDHEQVEWVAQHRRAAKPEAGRQADMLILVRGDVSEQVQHFRQTIYFDQHGQFSRRFQLQHVPAVVSQDGMQLRVEEVKP